MVEVFFKASMTSSIKMLCLALLLNLSELGLLTVGEVSPTCETGKGR